MTSAEELERFTALYEISHTTRFGIVDGISIDLRHPSIESTQWVSRSLWWSVHDLANSGRIWMPWFGEFSKDKIIAELESDLEDFGDNELVQDSFLYKFLMPNHFVESGDSIVIRRVVEEFENDPFAHIHDTEYRKVYLRIIRESGEREDVVEPLEFVGASSFSADGMFGRVTLGKIAFRICEYFKINNVEDYDIFEERMSYEEFALTEAQSFLRDIKPIYDLLPKFESVPHQSPNSADLDRAIDRATAIGYIWARAEANRSMRRHATSGLKSAKGASLAGQKSGEARRIKAASTWHPHALDLAGKARRDNPSASQDDVVSDVQAWWKLDIPCPGARTLKAFISSKEKTGDLQRRLGNEPR